MGFFVLGWVWVLGYMGIVLLLFLKRGSTLNFNLLMLLMEVVIQWCYTISCADCTRVNYNWSDRETLRMVCTVHRGPQSCLLLNVFSIKTTKPKLRQVFVRLFTSILYIICWYNPNYTCPHKPK